MQLPPLQATRAVIQRYARLIERYDAELGVRPAVLPTAQFFPDRFDGSPAAIAALMSRVQEHAGLADLKVELAIVTPEGEAQTVNCSSGACGGTGKIDVRIDRVTALGDGAYGPAISHPRRLRPHRHADDRHTHSFTWCCARNRAGSSILAAVWRLPS